MPRVKPARKRTKRDKLPELKPPKDGSIFRFDMVYYVPCLFDGEPAVALVVKRKDMAEYEREFGKSS